MSPNYPNQTPEEAARNNIDRQLLDAGWKVQDRNAIDYDAGKGDGHAMWQLFNRRGWRVTEPGAPYPPEHSELFDQMVYRALGQDLIGEAKAAEFRACHPWWHRVDGIISS